MLEQVSSRMIHLLFDASLKVLLVWVLALATVRLFRHMSVHVQHHIWAMVLLSLLILPVIGRVGPTWSVPISVWTASPATASIEPNPQRIRPQEGDSKPAHFDRQTDVRTSSQSGEVASSDPLIALARDSSAPERMPSTPSLRATPIVSTPTPMLSWRPSWVVMGSALWLTGVFLMFVRLVLVSRTVLNIRRAATPVTDPSLPEAVVIRESGLISSPVVVGWWRPSLLVPIDWREWNDAKRHAVFAHELSHLRRRDTQLSMLAELLTAIYWFHPVSWWTKRKLSQLAELACDEAAAIQVGDRCAYARYLVEIAAANRNRILTSAGLTMARSSEVGQRVRSLLDLTKPLSAKAPSSALAAVLLVIGPTVLVLAALRPIAAEPKLVQQEPVLENVSTQTPVAKAEPDAKSKQTAIAQENPAAVPKDIPVLTIKGTVLMPDGSVAREALLEQGREWRFNDVISTSIANGEYEIKTHGTDNTSFLVHTPDWDLQAALLIGGARLRQEMKSARKITLQPTKPIRITVRAGSQPTANGHVWVEAGSNRYRADTDANGVAEVRIPQDQSVFLLAAWSDDHKIGGLHVARKQGRDESEADLQVDISRGNPIRARAVDSNGQPIPNVPLDFVAVDGKRGELFVSGGPDSHQTTDARGEVVFQWVPEWAATNDDRAYVSVSENSAWRQVKREDRVVLPDKTRQLTLRPSRAAERVTVTGNLNDFRGDVTGTLVEFWSFDGEEEGSADVRFARCNAKGEFKTKVLPGSDYRVFVSDPELVSDFWNGVITLSTESVVRSPVLNVIEGVPVEIQITYGDAKKPMHGAWINFETMDKSNPRHAGGHRFWGQTDEQGRCQVKVAPGELEIRASKGDWEVKQTIEMVAGQDALVELHREVSERQKLSGRLVLPPGVSADLTNTSVMIAAIDGESKDEVTVRSDAQGNFTAAIAASRVSVLALSPKEQYFGRALIAVPSNNAAIPIHPTLSYEGQVLGENGQPVAGAKVRMLARLQDDPANYPPGTRQYDIRFVDLYRDRMASTDKNGRFVFPTAPRQMEVFISVTLPGEVEEADAYKRAYFQPGEASPLETIRAHSKKRAAEKHEARANRPLREIVSATLSYCRMTGVHALVMIPGPGEIPAPFIKTYITENKDEDNAETDDILSFLPLVISGPESAEMPDRRTYFAAHDWPFPEKNRLFLSALDGDGKELGRRMLKLNDDRAAARFVASFLKQCRPARRDAKAEYAAALAEAKRTNRRVWVRTIGTRCGACFRFSRWLDVNRELLAKDFVIVRINESNDEHGAELSEELVLRRHGVPCHTIVDADGRILVSSIGPEGNIGFPTDDEKQIAHLRKMLTETAQNLTSREIETLMQIGPDE